MKILVFDTCFNKTYIVLKENDKILASKIIESDDKNYHSVYLIPEIRNILIENELQIKNIDAIGVNIGPGSFTGIRAGITIARVLAQQVGAKLVGVPSLEILSCLNENNTHTTVVLDARKNKVYFGEYENGREITIPCLKEKEELFSCLKEDTFLIADVSIHDFFSENGVKSIKYEDRIENFGLYLASIVQNNLDNVKDDYNWAKVKPLYIQKPSITKSKEKTNV